MPSVFALRVVERPEVVKHVPRSFLAGFVCLASGAFAFQQLQEAFSHRVVPTLPATAQACHKIVLLKELIPLIAGEL
jgi:hypothetical protein